MGAPWILTPITSHAKLAHRSATIMFYTNFRCFTIDMGPVEVLTWGPLMSWLGTR